MLTSCGFGDWERCSNFQNVSTLNHLHRSKFERRRDNYKYAKNMSNRSTEQFIQVLNSLQTKFQGNNQPSYLEYDAIHHYNWGSMWREERMTRGVYPIHWLPPHRHDRKLHQIENMMDVSCNIIDALVNSYPNKRLRIVEFCCGTGFIGLPLAYHYPHHDIVLIDSKGPSIAIARQRIIESTLRNVEVVEMDIREFNESFDVGIALHACGGATDITLEKCLDCRASFILCSCCVGKILQYRQTPLSLPFQKSLNPTEFKALVKASDFGHADVNLFSLQERQRRICKCYIELDRCLLARQIGYEVYMLLMKPFSASPKNDIIFGWIHKDISLTNKLLRANQVSIEDSLFT